MTYPRPIFMSEKSESRFNYSLETITGTFIDVFNTKKEAQDVLDVLKELDTETSYVIYTIVA